MIVIITKYFKVKMSLVTASRGTLLCESFLKCSVTYSFAYVTLFTQNSNDILALYKLL